MPWKMIPIHEEAGQVVTAEGLRLPKATFEHVTEGRLPKADEKLIEANFHRISAGFSEVLHNEILRVTPGNNAAVTVPIDPATGWVEEIMTTIHSAQPNQAHVNFLIAIDRKRPEKTIVTKIMLEPSAREKLKPQQLVAIAYAVKRFNESHAQKK